jgi:hypothetical protein
VKLVEVAAKVAISEFSPNAGKNPKGGRPRKPDSEAKLAERIGVPQQTINVAKQHVAAVARYPELKTIPTQKDALTVAKNLDRLSDVERVHARRKTKASE